LAIFPNASRTPQLLSTPAHLCCQCSPLPLRAGSIPEQASHHPRGRMGTEPFLPCNETLDPLKGEALRATTARNVTPQIHLEPKWVAQEGCAIFILAGIQMKSGHGPAQLVLSGPA